MRVISGKRRGKKLAAPAGLDTRPTLDRVKQIMFDTVQFSVADSVALDLFCGSGQLGIEALSRGAAICYFNDVSVAALSVARRNISDCGFEKNARVSCNFHIECVTMLKTAGVRPDLVFLDPPYHKGLLCEALRALEPVAADGALIICEHATDETFDAPACFVPVKRKMCGEVSLTILKKERL